ncbi:hypothetical protein ACH347_42380 [Saccharopolyspora sp. 5N102]|uniref:hypothetical protein n=1 Tax=Saccharopolyspora sp. 5N102 TaxID=3375155 RepID=UPI0037A71B33
MSTFLPRTSGRAVQLRYLQQQHYLRSTPTPEPHPLLGADNVLTVETNDSATLLEHLEQLQTVLGFDCLATSCDYYLATAARAAGHLGLPGPPPEAVERACSKDLSRRAVRRNVRVQSGRSGPASRCLRRPARVPSTRVASSAVPWCCLRKSSQAAGQRSSVSPARASRGHPGSPKPATCSRPPPTATRPAPLIRDEATAALDAATQSGIVELLVDLRTDLGLAVMLIAHAADRDPRMGSEQRSRRSEPSRSRAHYRKAETAWWIVVRIALRCGTR